MRIAVTGATGLTGGAVVRELVRRGHDVVGTTRRRDGASEIEALGAHPEIADCTDPAALRRVNGRVEALVHVAGILLGEGVAASGIDDLKRVIVVSTAAIHSRHHRSAGRYRRNEDAIRGAAPHALFVRPTMIYGSPRDRNVHRVIAFVERWRILPLPDRGRARIQPIHYADLARAITALVESDAVGALDAGGPTPITLAEAARAIFTALGLRPLLVAVPVSLALPLARGLDGFARTRWAERLERTREDRIVDNARLREVTLIDPRSFDDGLRDEVAEIRAAGR